MLIWIKIIPYIAAVVGIFALYGAGYYSGVHDGKADCRLAMNNVIIEQQKKASQVRESIQNSLPPINANRREHLDWLLAADAVR